MSDGDGHGPGGRIDEIWAWIAIHPDGDEGIVAHGLVRADGTEVYAPLVGADQERIESYRGLAMEISERVGVPVRLVRFTARVVVEDA